ELRERLEELEQQRISLEQQAQAAEGIKAAEQLKQQLEQDVRRIESDLDNFDQLEKLRAAAPLRGAQQQEIEQQVAEINEELAQSEERSAQLNQKQRDLSNKLSELQGQHQEIERRRNQRSDVASQFSYLDQLPHHAWLAAAEIPLPSLASKLAEYQTDCN